MNLFFNIEYCQHLHQTEACVCYALLAVSHSRIDAFVWEGFGNFQNYYSFKFSVQKNHFILLFNIKKNSNFKNILSIFAVTDYCFAFFLSTNLNNLRILDTSAKVIIYNVYF